MKMMKIKVNPLDKKYPINPIAISVFIILIVLVQWMFAAGFIGIKARLALSIASALIAASIRIADQWEKAIVLRMGRFIGLRGPGIFFIIPIIDRVDKYIDQRVRVTDFMAEKTLTRDTVPVDVDAVVYWMVWDAEKAALEVEQYHNAVSYIAQTCLRDIIGRHELADLLQNREQIGESLQGKFPLASINFQTDLALP